MGRNPKLQIFHIITLMKIKAPITEAMRHDNLSKLFPILERLSNVIDFEMFRPPIEAALKNEAKGPGGRPPFDYIMMFKILIFQAINNNLSDKKTEYALDSNVNYRHFVGIGIYDKVPDATTIWLFREKLIKTSVYNRLFDLFLDRLENLGLILREATLIDSTFVSKPIQRNTHEENQQIKNGKGDTLWPDEPNKRRQKDIDARHTKKHNKDYYGEKNHVKVDYNSKLIIKFEITSAAVHDINLLMALIDEKDKFTVLDSAYNSKELINQAETENPSLDLNVILKALRDTPLLPEDKVYNRLASKIRARVEHVFGYVKNSMGGYFVRAIGIARTKCYITLKNLAYNILRYEILVRLYNAPKMI